MAMIDESTNSARMQSRHLITVLSRKKKRKIRNDKYGGRFLGQMSPPLSTISYNKNIRGLEL